MDLIHLLEKRIRGCDGFLPRVLSYISEKILQLLESPTVQWMSDSEWVVEESEGECEHTKLPRAHQESNKKWLDIYWSMCCEQYHCFNVHAEQQRTTIINWSLFWEQLICNQVASEHIHTRGASNYYSALQSFCVTHTKSTLHSQVIHCTHFKVHNSYTKLTCTCISEVILRIHIGCISLHHAHTQSWICTSFTVQQV